MTLMLDLAPELEQRLRAQASARGISLEALILEDLEARAAPASSRSRLDATETALMQVVTDGLPEAFWTRYRYLIDLRDRELLGGAQQAELIACADRVEHLSARRAEALVELAARRGMSVEMVRAELGLQPVPVAA